MNHPNDPPSWDYRLDPPEEEEEEVCPECGFSYPCECDYVDHLLDSEDDD